MAEINLDLASLFREAFGRPSEAFDPDLVPVPSETSLNPNVPQRVDNGASGSPYYAIDANGREYFMPVTITWTESQDTGLVSPMTSHVGGLSLTVANADTLSITKTWDLPYPVISISSNKNIIKTPLTERRGSVKELINTEDYEISIKGFIIDETNQFPETGVATLRGIYEQNKAVSIKCPLTDIFLLRPDRGGSDQVVIKSINFPALKGVKGVKPYEIVMWSDEPFNLIDIS